MSSTSKTSRASTQGATNPHGALAARVAADAVREPLGVRSPVAALILGSGLGALADQLTNARRVPYAEIPGFHAPGVEGHRGELLCGTLGGREVLLLAGRFHMYEGHSAQAAAFPVRVMHALGAPVLFVSNAAGGIRRDFAPGTLMAIRDHLNLQFRNPLTGGLEPGDLRFPDMSAPYAPRLTTLLHEAAAEGGPHAWRGCLRGVVGAVLRDAGRSADARAARRGRRRHEHRPRGDRGGDDRDGGRGRLVHHESRGGALRGRALSRRGHGGGTALVGGVLWTRGALGPAHLSASSASSAIGASSAISGRLGGAAGRRVGA